MNFLRQSYFRLLIAYIFIINFLQNLIDPLNYQWCLIYLSQADTAALMMAHLASRIQNQPEE